jgi:hypothetical protein
MAEIRLEKKRTSPLVWLIPLLLILALLAWWFLSQSEVTPAAGTAADSAAISGPAPATPAPGDTAR